MINKYEFRDDHVVIFLNRKDGTVLETKIDLIGFEKIMNMQVRWYAHYDPKMLGFYAVGYQRGSGRKGKKLKLHRVLTDATDEQVVDHINHDTLDNQGFNIRATTPLVNQRNRGRISKNNTSGVPNVRYRKDSNNWQAYMHLDGKFKSLGSYATKEEAEIASIKGKELNYKQEVI